MSRTAALSCTRRLTRVIWCIGRHDGLRLTVPARNLTSPSRESLSPTLSSYWHSRREPVIPCWPRTPDSEPLSNCPLSKHVYLGDKRALHVRLHYRASYSETYLSMQQRRSSYHPEVGGLLQPSAVPCLRELNVCASHLSLHDLCSKLQRCTC